MVETLFASCVIYQTRSLGVLWKLKLLCLDQIWCLKVRGILCLVHQVQAIISKLELADCSLPLYNRRTSLFLIHGIRTYLHIYEYCTRYTRRAYCTRYAAVVIMKCTRSSSGTCMREWSKSYSTQYNKASNMWLNKQITCLVPVVCTWLTYRYC